MQWGPQAPVACGGPSPCGPVPLGPGPGHGPGRPYFPFVLEHQPGLPAPWPPMTCGPSSASTAAPPPRMGDFVGGPGQPYCASMPNQVSQSTLASTLPSTAPDTAEGGLLVPVDYANSKLWGLTSEYENLLSIQRDQHQAMLRQRDAEVAHLRKALELAEAGRLDEGSMLMRVRAKEEEVRFGLEAKQRELELFAALLQMRDRQVGDLQEMCEAKQAQVVNLQRSAKEVDGGGGGEGWAEVVRELEELRQEKAELEHLVILKDKQLSAVQAVDPGMSDASALQLGAQAIQMFHDSIRLKSEASRYGQEQEELRAEVERLQERVEELEAQLAEKREEVKEIASALTARTQRALDLEVEMESLQRERRQNSREAASQLERLQADLDAWRRDCEAAQQLAEQLRVELADRDERFVRQQAETMQQQVLAQQYARKVEDMSVQLGNAENVLAEMVRSSKYKDRLIREMSEQVNISESKLHAYHLSELVDSRRRLLDPDSKDDGSPPGLQKESRLGAEGPGGLGRRRPVQSAHHDRHGFQQSSGSFSTGLYPDDSAASCGFDVSRLLAPAVASRANSPRTAGSSVCASPSPTPGSYRSGRRDSMGNQELLPREPPRTRSFGVSEGRSPAGHSVGGSASLPSFAPFGGAAGGQRLEEPVVHSSAAFALFAQSYRPHPGDPVDAKVAEFVNQPQHGACKALFCRLGEGSYLYGTQRTSLRLRDGRLEASFSGAWVPIEDFVQRLLASQGVHLQRARELTSGGGG